MNDEFRFVIGSGETEVVNRRGFVYDAIHGDFVREDYDDALKAFVDEYPQIEEVPAPDGRAQVGEANPSAKLTADQVAEIRARYADGRGQITQHELAVMYGVNQTTISRVVRGVSYSD